MAVFTNISLSQATHLSQAHGLGNVAEVIPIPAGSVNSNFFFETEKGRKFARVYEEQDEEGVVFEWKVLAFLKSKKIPVPEKIPGPSTRETKIESKPTAIFELVEGDQLCQASVTPEKIAKVGGLLAEVHLKSQKFLPHKQSRFSLPQILNHLTSLKGQNPKFDDQFLFLQRELEKVISQWPKELPSGLIHGDLFRDNVFWQEERISALIDWESASHGFFALDLMITLLAWCFTTRFEPELVHSLIQGYQGVRNFSEEEAQGMHTLAMGAALRFTFTRIRDFEIKKSVGERVHKDFRRFLSRYQDIKSVDSSKFSEWLGVTR